MGGISDQYPAGARAAMCLRTEAVSRQRLWRDRARSCRGFRYRSTPRAFRRQFLEPDSAFLSNHLRERRRDVVEKDPNARGEMLPVDADREEANLIAPKVFQTFDKHSCLKVWLNVPNRFQRDPSSGLYPVVDYQTAG